MDFGFWTRRCCRVVLDYGGRQASGRHAHDEVDFRDGIEGLGNKQTGMNGQVFDLRQL